MSKAIEVMKWILCAAITLPAPVYNLVKLAYYSRCGTRESCTDCGWAGQCSRRPLTEEEAEELQRYIAELTAEWEEQ